jgi:AraC-like DNA-binding protein
VRVFLLGSGLPTFWVVDMGDLSFTLGLSGWTANDWSTAGNFDLLAPRAEVDDYTKRRVFDGLKEKWLDTPDALASRLGLSRTTILGALGAWTQAGRAMYDLAKGVYRVRELAREPLPMDTLRFSNEREASATRLLTANSVQSTARASSDGGVELSGTVKDRSHTYRASLTIDADARITRAQCECNFFQQNKLFKGPCEHMLALRMHDARRRPVVFS